MSDDLLPPNATPAERALSVAISPSYEVGIKQLWNAQTCPVGILPWLAWALSVEVWDTGWTEAQKRTAIQNSISEHFKKGTSGYLRRALESLGYDVEINERTGTAYVFRVSMKLYDGSTAGGSVFEAAKAAVTAVALSQKNARSSLGGVDILTTPPSAHIYIAGLTMSGCEVQISP